MQRHNRSSKYKPVVEETDLIHATPRYAFVRFKNGHESTVSLRDIAPLPDSKKSISSNVSNNTVTNVETNDETLAEENNKETETETAIEKSFDAEMFVESSSSNSKDIPDEAIPLRLSSRIKKEPDRLMYHHNH